MIELDGSQFEGFHVIVIRGRDLSWNAQGQCLQIGGEPGEMEVTPAELNLMMHSDHLMYLQAITTAKHDSVLVFADYDWADR